MQFNLTLTHGRLGLDHIPWDHSFQAPLPPLEMEGQAPELEMRSRLPRVEVDLAPARDELGYRRPGPFQERAAASQRQEAHQGVARVAAEGDRLARVDLDPEAIPRLARERAFRGRPPVNVVPWPSAPLPVRVVPGELEIGARLGHTRVLYQPARFQGQFSWGRIEAYLLQEPSVQVEARAEWRV